MPPSGSPEQSRTCDAQVPPPTGRKAKNDYAGVVATVLAVGALAALVPAVRASRTEPMRVLREE